MAQSKNKNGGASTGGTHQTGVGPRDVTGLDASELPDGGRGGVETDPVQQLKRKLPGQTGAIEDGTDVGMAAMPDIADARDHGARKHN